MIVVSAFSAVSIQKNEYDSNHNNILNNFKLNLYPISIFKSNLDVFYEIHKSQILNIRINIITNHVDLFQDCIMEKGTADDK